jgi:hypothetical protein
VKREPGFYWVRLKNPNYLGSDNWTIVRYSRTHGWLIGEQWMKVPKTYFIEVDERQIKRLTD